MTSLKALSKGVFSLTSVRADARLHHGQGNRSRNSGAKSSPVLTTYNHEFSESDNESGTQSTGKNQERRISTPEMLRNALNVVNIKVFEDSLYT